MSTYLLKGGAAAASRLKALAEAAWPMTRRALELAGVSSGWCCLDVGCGAGHVAIELARLTGPEGRVVGEDADERILAVARGNAEAAGVQVEFRQRDVLHSPDAGTFDLAYARFLLSHLADPVRGLAYLVESVPPGGVVLVEDVDFRSHFCWPPSQAFERYDQLYRGTAQGLGADPLIGPRLAGLLLDAGLDDVQVEAVERLFSTGTGKLLPQLTMEHIREAAVRSGATTNEEVDAIVAELDRIRQDPRSIMGFPRVFQVWGLKV